jgi:hypothetical protein
MTEGVLTTQRCEIRLVLVPGPEGAGRLDPSARDRIGDARLEAPRLAATHAIQREIVDLEDPRQPARPRGWDLEACRARDHPVNHDRRRDDRMYRMRRKVGGCPPGLQFLDIRFLRLRIG